MRHADRYSAASACRSRPSLVTLFLIVAFLSSPAVAWPCGVCHEDDRAAVYSHEAMEKARQDPTHLEFVVLKAKGPLTEKVARRLTSWLAKREGIDPATVNISTAQRSIGFVWKRVFSKEMLKADLEQAFPAFQFVFLQYDS